MGRGVSRRTVGSAARGGRTGGHSPAGGGTSLTWVKAISEGVSAPSQRAAPEAVANLFTAPAAGENDHHRPAPRRRVPSTGSGASAVSFSHPSNPALSSQAHTSTDVSALSAPALAMTAQVADPCRYPSFVGARCGVTRAVAPDAGLAAAPCVLTVTQVAAGVGVGGPDGITAPCPRTGRGPAAGFGVGPRKAPQCRQAAGLGC